MEIVEHKVKTLSEFVDYIKPESGFPAFQPCIPHAVRKAMTLLCT